MPRKTQIRVNIKTATLNVEEFNALTDLLYELLKGNQAACARALGISRPTWKRWEKEPPQWPWWNLVLRNVITELLAHLNGRGGITNHHRNRIRDSLSKISKSETLIEEAERLSYEYTGAEAHLRRLLSRKGMWWSDIKLAANSGGYTKRTLRVAAAKLRVIKTQEGYGSDKDSYWRLPDQDDD